MAADLLINRAQILMRQSRFEEAGTILKDLLRQEPNNVYLLALLAQVELQQEHAARAEQLINSAIGLSPDTSYLYYIKARIALQNEQYNEAEKHLQQAISIDPGEADYFALMASVKLTRKQYAQALEMAEEALDRDAENILGANVRSTALLKLNRKDEFYQAMEGALAHDPNNAYTHANYGWGLLEKGDHEKALGHFREALKNDPHYAYAQGGMMEALKARYLFYRLFLRYSFFISNLTAKYQWVVIVGFYVVSRALNSLSENNPALQPFLMPVLIVMALFAFSTWVIAPLSNLFLRFNMYGKYLLDKREKMSSNFVAGSLLVCLGGLAGYLATDRSAWLIVALVGFAMMIPLGTMFSVKNHHPKLVIYASVMLLLGLLGIYTAFRQGDIYNTFTALFLFSFIAYQWIANFLRIRQSNR